MCEKNKKTYMKSFNLLILNTLFQHKLKAKEAYINSPKFETKIYVKLFCMITLTKKNILYKTGRL